MNKIEVSLIKDIHNNFIDNLFDEIARLHIEEIPGGFLSSLGESFLANMYCEISKLDESILLIALVEKRFAGFICASKNTKKIILKYIFKNAIFSIFKNIKYFLNINYIIKGFETIKYELLSKNPKQDINAEIMNFCVKKIFQRRGIGKMLFNECIDELQKRHIYKVKITTGLNQISANSFYMSVGAKPVGIAEVHNNEISNVYIYDIKKYNDR